VPGAAKVPRKSFYKDQNPQEVSYSAVRVASR
jgi:hypothetical protein